MRSLVAGEPASYDGGEISKKGAPATGPSCKELPPVSLRITVLVLNTALALSACSKNPLKITRNPCPPVAVPAYTGDVTLFSRPGTTHAEAMAVVTVIRSEESGGGKERV